MLQNKVWCITVVENVVKLAEFNKNRSIQESMFNTLGITKFIHVQWTEYQTFSASVCVRSVTLYSLQLQENKRAAVSTYKIFSILTPYVQADKLLVCDTNPFIIQLNCFSRIVKYLLTNSVQNQLKEIWNITYDKWKIYRLFIHRKIKIYQNYGLPKRCVHEDWL